MKVSWGYEIPNIWRKNMFQTTNQLITVCFTCFTGFWMILVRIHSSSVISWRFLVPSPGFSPISCLEFATAEVLWLRHHPESNLLRTGYRTKAGCLQIPTPKAINRSYNVIYNFKNQLCKHNFWVGTCRATTNSKVIPDDPSDLTPSI